MWRLLSRWSRATACGEEVGAASLPRLERSRFWLEPCSVSEEYARREAWWDRPCLALDGTRRTVDVLRGCRDVMVSSEACERG